MTSYISDFYCQEISGIPRVLLLYIADAGCSSKSKTKRVMYDSAENEDFDREEIPTYEEVARLFPRAGRYRPIVMLGPPGIVLRTLVVMLGHPG